MILRLMPEKKFESQLRAYDLIKGNSIRVAHELTFLRNNNLASMVNRSAS